MSKQCNHEYGSGCARDHDYKVFGYRHGDHCACGSPESRCAGCGTYTTGRLCEGCKEAK